MLFEVLDLVEPSRTADALAGGTGAQRRHRGTSLNLFRTLEPRAREDVVIAVLRGLTIVQPDLSDSASAATKAAHNLGVPTNAMARPDELQKHATDHCSSDTALESDNLDFAEYVMPLEDAFPMVKDVRNLTIIKVPSTRDHAIRVSMQLLMQR